MNEAVQEFIESHIELIDKNDFTSLYIKATTIWTFPDNNNTSILTETLLDASINPLDYMDYIPLCMFWNSNISTIDIPETITFIENDAFFGSQLTQVSIPASCDSIGPNAFAMCHNLNKIIILNPNIDLDNETFSESPIKYITYNGTIAQWITISKDLILPEKYLLQANDNFIIIHTRKS